MGIRILSRSSYDGGEKVNEVNGNPNPRNFEIERYMEKFPYTLVKIKYPDCNNYEGKKILLYNCSFEQLKKQGNEVGLDPHFSNNKKYVSPIARFEPTEFGWECGKRIINILLN